MHRGIHWQVPFSSHLTDASIFKQKSAGERVYCIIDSVSRTRVASTNYKDISLCDILGTGSDYLFLPYEDTLYVLTHPTSMPILIVISVLTVYMTVILAHNLEFSIQVSDPIP
jgi:hypothetical protein